MFDLFQRWPLCLVMNTVTQVRAKKEKILRVHHLDPQGNATTQAEDFVFLEVKANTDFTDHKNTL